VKAEDVLKKLQGKVVDELDKAEALDDDLLCKVELYTELARAIQTLAEDRILQEKSEYLQRLLESSVVVKGGGYYGEGGSA
jgi:hypothetical protein